MATNRKWPSRSRELPLYASPEEIAAAIAALRMIWSDYGRQMKIAAKEAGPFARSPRENTYLYDCRFWAMSETERELAHRVDRWRDKRQAVKLAIKALREGFVPEWSALLPPPPSPLVAIIGRYDDAVKAGDERYAAEIAGAN